MDRAAEAISSLESSLPFRDKIPKAVWRGTTWFNSIHSPNLRRNLIAATKNKTWADVQPLEWKNVAVEQKLKVGKGKWKNTGKTEKKETAVNALKIEDFCRYKYVMHTEGVTYSGRFQFLQMCNSIVITPPIHWLQHTTHLVRPLFSGSILSSSAPTTSEGKQGKERKTTTKGGWKPTPRIQRAWPVQHPPEEANIVFVAQDWSDLEETIAWLEEHPRIAEGIARRQRELFVGGGYFSPAAEVCYWRAMVRGWASMARVDRDEAQNLEGEDESDGNNRTHWADEEGVKYELFSLSNGM